MAFSISDANLPLSYKVLMETDCEKSTPIVNATGTSGTLYSAHVDNSANGSQINHLMIYDGTDLVIDTTHADMILRVAAGKQMSFTFPGGWAFTSLSFWCSSSATFSSQADPGSAIKVTLVTS